MKTWSENVQLEEKVKEMHHKREDLYLKREMAPANVTVSVMNATLHQINFIELPAALRVLKDMKNYYATAENLNEKRTANTNCDDLAQISDRPPEFIQFFSSTCQLRISL